ncbi:hypothetical protein [Nocardia paucivorans]|uniref:hypothetical protein n=1 Tax=Nocardia paucivorans TaxID=114259 RepID=UPI0003014822|nr:hypothetical protein [Nocardia paucivorans]
MKAVRGDGKEGQGEKEEGGDTRNEDDTGQRPTEKAEPYLYLWTMDLFSKYGFDDGELIYRWLERAADAGHDVESWWCTGCGHERFDRSIGLVLRDLVHKYFLPEIPGEFTVWELDTIHNPIRIDTWRGEKWQGREGDAPPEAVGVEVTVPGNAVVTTLERMTEQWKALLGLS